MSEIIKVDHLGFTYPGVEDAPGAVVFEDMNLTVEAGTFVAVLGSNGCGKSTLAKHFNAILLPSGGKVYVSGLDTSDEDKIIAIRRSVGMVFQNPDNQIDYRDFYYDKKYKNFGAYARSKLCLARYTYHLAKRQKDHGDDNFNSQQCRHAVEKPSENIRQQMVLQTCQPAKTGNSRHAAKQNQKIPDSPFFEHIRNDLAIQRPFFRRFFKSIQVFLHCALLWE